jgi:pyridoxine/pyridoxamine 5'-phosphate oxidase
MIANTYKAAMVKRLGILIPDEEKEEDIISPNNFIHTEQLKSDPNSKRVIFSGIDNNGVVYYVYNWLNKGQSLNPTFDSDSNYVYAKSGYTVI